MVDLAIRTRTPEELAELTMYRTKLSRHDWWYSRADDNTVYRQGKASYDAIARLRDRIDPDNVIWNQMAPDGFKRT